MPETQKAFRALTGINVPGKKEGTERRYEAGDKITDVDENVLAAEIKSGNVIPWEDTAPEAQEQPVAVFYGERGKNAQEGQEESVDNG